MSDQKTKTHLTSQLSKKSSDDALCDHSGLSTQTMLPTALVLVVVAYLVGLRVARRKARRALIETSSSNGTRTVSTRTGVEFFDNEKGYRIRVEKTLEHRYLAEQCLGRSLEATEVVHHINGGRSDNRLENLCVLHHLKHEQFHSWLKWKKDKEGRYPAESVIREILVSEYGGIVLPPQRR